METKSVALSQSEKVDKYIRSNLHNGSFYCIDTCTNESKYLKATHKESIESVLKNSHYSVRFGLNPYCMKGYPNKKPETPEEIESVNKRIWWSKVVGLSHIVKHKTKDSYYLSCYTMPNSWRKVNYFILYKDGTTRTVTRSELMAEDIMQGSYFAEKDVKTYKKPIGDIISINNKLVMDILKG